MIKSTDFDTKLIKKSIKIDLESIIQSKTVDLYQKLIEFWSNLSKICLFLVFLVQIRPNFDQIRLFLVRLDSNSDRDFESDRRDE